MLVCCTVATEKLDEALKTLPVLRPEEAILPTAFVTAWDATSDKRLAWLAAAEGNNVGGYLKKVPVLSQPQHAIVLVSWCAKLLVILNFLSTVLIKPGVLEIVIKFIIIGSLIPL